MYGIKYFILEVIEAVTFIPALWEDIKANHATWKGGAGEGERRGGGKAEENLSVEA